MGDDALKADGSSRSGLVMMFAVVVCAGLIHVSVIAQDDGAAEAGAVDQVEAPTMSARELNDAARAAFDAGDYAAAIEGYARLAEMLPTVPQAPYNLGVAHFRNGEYEKAAASFDLAQSLTQDAELRANAAYNAGNSTYQQVRAALDDPEADPQKVGEQLDLAESKLGGALDHYRASLAAEPRNPDAEREDARVNAELTNQLLKQVRDLKEQMEQQQDQQQEQGQGQDQDNQDQQEQDQQEQQQDQQQQDQPQQSQDQGDQQQQQEQQGQPQQQPQEGEQESEQEQQQQQQQGEQEQSESEEQGDGQEVEGQPQAMTKEEAERLLQRVRDKESQRRKALARKADDEKEAAERDW